MALKNLMVRLQCRAADTPDTLEKIMGYQRKAPIHAGCTLDTPDTSCFADAYVSSQFVPFGEAVTDPAVPELKIMPSEQPPDLAQPPAPAHDKPAKPRKQTFMDHTDTWLHLDRAYQAHHFKCPSCKAAGLGYGLRCGAGAALWRTYLDASS